MSGIQSGQLFLTHKDYSQDKVLLGLSGGINSMAVLVWMAHAPFELKPKELHLVYHHFAEHSPDTFRFVADGIRYARRHFPDVRVRITRNSVLKFFEEQKFIPHPTISPCTKYLKLLPTYNYMTRHNITVNVIGYVREEIRRVKRMADRTDSSYLAVEDKGISMDFPIAHFSDEWCFQVVDKEIGWHPAIYDIKNRKGKRIFTHNNCLPCKNMEMDDLQNVKLYYPDYFARAHKLTEILKRHWGRDSADYYTEFGRPEHDGSPCDNCIF